jgi:patatin-related protein
MSTSEATVESTPRLNVPHELRLAVTMNGGVSLAVYIGGVAHEFNRLSNNRGSYLELVKYLGYDTQPAVDVITGTSAGAINATALALGQANKNDTDLSLLKLLWIEHGQIGSLLRQPFREGPPSLLKGDEYFYPRILSTLQRLISEYERSETDIDLAITTTLLTSVPAKTHDDLGLSMVQPGHAALFEFRGKRLAAVPDELAPSDQPAGRDVFCTDDIQETVRALALAARASASFPVAFEPTFVPVNHPEPLADRPDMAEYVSWLEEEKKLKHADASRFAVDGSVLANTPTKAALNAIRRHKATEHLVRRVLVLVHPHATPANTVQDPPDAVDEPPSLIGAVGGVFRASSSVGSRTYVEEIELHNELALRWRDGRRFTMTMIRGWNNLSRFLSPNLPAWRLFHALRTQRAAYVLADQIRNRTSVPLAQVVEQAGIALKQYKTDPESVDLPFLPAGPPDRANLPRGQWRWGLDFAAGTTQLAIDLLRGLLSTPAEKLSVTIPEANAGQLKTILAEAKRAWSEAVNASVALDEFRKAEERAANILDAETPNIAGFEQIRDRLKRNLTRYSERMGPGSQQPAEGAATISDGAKIDKIVREMVCSPLFTVVSKVQLILPANPDDELAGTLLGRNPLQGVADSDELLLRLLTIEILAYLVAEDSSTDSSTPSTPIEFYQLSAQVDQHFAKDFRPDDKLAGMSLNRFGAILKRSWRANDWIWGRLDAVKLLMLILLTPANLRSSSRGRPVSPEDIVDEICTTCFPSPDPTSQSPAPATADSQAPEPGQPDQTVMDLGLQSSNGVSRDRPPSWLPPIEGLPDLYRAAVSEVGAAIADQGQEPLSSLASLAAYGLQLSVAADELPWLATTVIYDQEDGATGGRSSAFLSRFNNLQQRADSTQHLQHSYELLKLFTDARIGQEAVADELPSDLMIRTAARAAATSVTMLGSARSGLTVARPVTGLLRGAVAVPYWTVTGLAHRGPLARIAAATTLALGTSLVALSLIAPLNAPLNALVPTIGVGSIVTIFTYAAMRSRSVVHGAALVGLFIPLLALAANRLWGHSSLGDAATPTATSSSSASEPGFHLAIPEGMLAVTCVFIVIAGTVLAANINSPVSSPFAQIYSILNRLRNRVNRVRKRTNERPRLTGSFPRKHLVRIGSGLLLSAVVIFGGWHLWRDGSPIRHRLVAHDQFFSSHVFSKTWITSHHATVAALEIGLALLPFVIIALHGIVVGRMKSRRLRPRPIVRTTQAGPTEVESSNIQRNLLIDPAGLSAAWSGAYGLTYLILSLAILIIYGHAPPVWIVVASTAAFVIGVGFSIIAVHVIPARRERRLIKKLAVILPPDSEVQQNVGEPINEDVVVTALNRIGEDSQYLFNEEYLCDSSRKRLSHHGDRVVRKALQTRRPHHNN